MDVFFRFFRFGQNGLQPPPKKNGHNLGPRDTWDPKQGPLGPHLACDQTWSAGVSPRTAPKTGKGHLFGVLGPFRAPGGREVFLRPPDPVKVQYNSNCEPSKVQNIRSCATRTRFRWGKTVPKTPPDRWRRVTAKTGPSSTRVRTRDLPDTYGSTRIRTRDLPDTYGSTRARDPDPGPRPPWVGDRPPKTSESRIAGKTVKHHPTSSA